MSAHMAIVVDWYGPYPLGSARLSAEKDYGAGLYLAIGRRTSSKENRIQYVGISKDLGSRLYTSAKLGLLNQGAKIWLGEVSTVRRTGAPTQINMAQVHLAEWLVAYYLRPKLNAQKTTNPPKKVTTLLNRWWKTDYVTPRLRRPHKDWPDIIDFAPAYGGSLGWARRTAYIE